MLTRGHNDQAVFHEDADRQRYLRLLAGVARLYQVKVYHFVLMPNHVHLILETTYGEALSRAMLTLNLTYSLFYRKRYSCSGHLWQGRFKSRWIDRDRSLLACGRYIELNPVRAGLALHPNDYPWSSYRAYAHGSLNSLVTINPLYGTFGATPAQRQFRYRQFIDEALLAPQPEAPRAPFRVAASEPRRIAPLEELLGLTGQRRRGRPRQFEVQSYET